MMQRDYIMRMIEQFGQFVTALVHLRDAGKLEEARAAIDQAMIGLVASDLRTASEQPAERLIATVRFAARMYATSAPAAYQLNMLGRLLRESADVLDLQEDHETATKVRFQALDVHTAVLTVDDPASPESRDATDALVERLHEFELPGVIKQRLWSIHTARGHYAQAEDWLFEALDADAVDPNLLAEAIESYAGLTALDEAALEAGDVSREEVLVTLAELRQRALDTSEQLESSER